jgi:5-methylcytosine-specific restriction endonuclease McrA
MSDTERRRAQHAAWYAAHREERRARNAAWRIEHREERLAYEAVYRAEHREEHAASGRAYLATPRGRLAQALANARRQVRERKQPAWIDPALTLDAACAALLPVSECYYCGCDLGDDWQLEHKIPLSRGGAHTLSNLAMSCPECNRDKRSMTDREFMAWLIPSLPRWPGWERLFDE